MDETRFLTGQLLLAMPGIGDPRFERSVIAMCVHDEAGALGIGLGQIMPGTSLHALLQHFDIDCDGVPAAPVHEGGPVEPQRGFVLHSDDWGGQGSIHVAGRWVLSGSIDALRALGRPGGPSRWVVAMGYAGWGAGQLDGELLRHGWHVAQGDDDLLFDLPCEQRWAEAFRRDGIDPALLSAASGHA